MKRIAIYVEGDAELIFVRNFLLKWYDYDTERLGIECCKLRADREDYEPYPHGTQESENFYYIVNVGNDSSVLSKMIKNAERLYNSGYQLVVGLRDMYCDAYHEKTHIVNKGRVIDRDIIDKFRKGSRETIQNGNYPVEMQMHFAIMEIEAWLLGLSETLDAGIDPENAFYHPASEIVNHFSGVLTSYGKHKSEVEKLTGRFTKDDFVKLLSSDKCASLRIFAEAIVEI